MPDQSGRSTSSATSDPVSGDRHQCDGENHWCDTCEDRERSAHTPWCPCPICTRHHARRRPHLACVSRHHQALVLTENGTDRCDNCWADAQAEQESQQW